MTIRQVIIVIPNWNNDTEVANNFIEVKSCLLVLKFNINEVIGFHLIIFMWIFVSLQARVIYKYDYYTGKILINSFCFFFSFYVRFYNRNITPYVPLVHLWFSEIVPVSHESPGPDQMTHSLHLEHLYLDHH